MPRTFITTVIPYVNSKPHLGFAMELVQTDVMARHRRHRGHEVRFCSGTDDNSLKNAMAAEAEGIPTRQLVDRNAAAFHDLRDPLRISFDDFLRTSADPRHAVGVERLWKAVEAAGDLELRDFSGLYCVGCEQFYDEQELVDGICPEHGSAPQRINERNWFFQLSRYEDRLRDLIARDELRIEPETRRNEVLSFLDRGLRDFSVSRSRERARDWGIPVPGDDGQVIYVWFDALINYITSLDYGTGGADFDRWWTDADEVIHVIGKGILRFHAVYWPAMLLSADLPLPRTIFVHDYLTADGRKLGKSLGNSVDPRAIAEEYGADALRWWLVREVPRTGDTDFSLQRLVARYQEDLAHGVGNLLHRTITMVRKYRAGRITALDALPTDQPLVMACETVSGEVDAAMNRFDFRTATAAIFGIVDAANRYVETTTPWTLARAEKNGDADATEQLDTALATLVHACRTLADELTPFLPDAAREAARQLGDGEDRVGEPTPLFPHVDMPPDE